MAAALVCAACGPLPPAPDGGVDAGLDAGAIELGTTGADGGFVPLEGPVDGIPGSQGGFHVNVLYRLPEGGSGQLTFEHQVRRIRDERLVSRGSRLYDLGQLRSAPWETADPVTVFMCPTPIGVDIIGEALRFSVTAKDAQGRVVGAGSSVATFRCGSASGAFCEAICKG